MPKARTFGMAPKCHYETGIGREKLFTLQTPISSNACGKPAPASVPSGRANFNPRRWWSSRWVTQTAFACMIREVVFMPWIGPRGALGISNETTDDLGKDRRTTTKAPPAEILTAVANSRESLPAPSRARMKTGMASCSLVDLRSSFFDMLRDTYHTHP